MGAVEEAIQLLGMAGPQNPARKYRSRPRTKQPRFGETPLFPPILCLFNIILTHKSPADPDVGADGASEEEEEQNQPKPKRGRRPAGAYSNIISHNLA